MASPTRSDLHVNRPLSNISVAYQQDANNFIADRVFPVVPVDKQSDRYFTYGKDDWFRDEAQERAPSTESAGSGWEVDNTPTYYARVYAFHKDVDDQLRPNADEAVANLDRDATMFVTQKMLLRKERVFVNNYFKTGVWGLDLTGVPGVPGGNQFKQWDQAGSTPIADIDAQRIAIAEKTGFRPNKLVIGPYVWKALKNHADILDRVKYTQRGQITLDLLAALFEVDEVLVPFGTENTAVKGATASMSFFFGKAALLVYAAPAPSLMLPTGGYTFAWKGYTGASNTGTRIKKFRMEHLTSDRIEGEIAFDQKLVAADVGTYFTAAVA